MIHNNLDELLKNYAEWKKPISEGYILHDSIYTTLLKWQNYTNGKQVGGCQRLLRRLGWEESRQNATWGILEHGNALHPYCINVNMVWCDTDYSYVRCFIRGHWVTVYGIYGLFLTTVCESTIISKEKV